MVLWKQDGLAVVNKPHGLMVHHPDGGEDLLKRLKLDQGWPVVHACHRLDTAAAGALLVAYESRAAGPGSALFARREVHKVYLALCTGLPPWERQTVDKALERQGRRSHAVDQDEDEDRGLPAATDVRVLGRGRDASLVLCRTRTGRFHQVRAHLAAAGHPLVGDRHYGATHDVCLGLHALRLALVHPLNNAAVDITAPPWPLFRRAVDRHGVLPAVLQDAPAAAAAWSRQDVD